MTRFFKRYRKLLLQFNSIMAALSGLALALSFIFKSSFEGKLFLIFTLIAAASAGFPIIYDSLKMIFKGKINVGLLVSTAIIASIVIREFQAAAIVAFIMMAGEFLENLTVARASMAIKGLLEITPTKATVRRDGKDEEASVSELNPEDVILVKSGERIPVDGVVTGGSSCIDQATITGESIPVAKETGDEVFAGTLNQIGALEIKVTKTGKDTTLGQIVRLVESAQKSTAPVERTADKFARYFVPISFLIAVIVYLLTGEIIRAITVLIVACPCALVLATPTAIIAGIGNAAKSGIVVKGGIHLENAGKLDLFAFDKTGTLTKGTAKLANIVPLDGKSENELLVLAATVEKFSEHPLAKAILREARERNLEVKDPEDFAVAAGFGVKARINGENITVGTRAFLAREGIKFDDVNDVIKSLEEEGRTVVLVSSGRKVLGLLGLEDAIRDGAADAVKNLQDLGIDRRVLLTGDNKMAARRVANVVGATEFHPELLPGDKMSLIKKWQGEGRKVAMVGDGINDSPALALADLGIAMGKKGTHIAVESAKVALMGDELDKLPYLVKLSRKTLRVIIQNIVFSTIINLLSVGLAGFGLISPVLGAFIHNGSSFLVVVNSAGLINTKAMPIGENFAYTCERSGLGCCRTD